MTQYWEPGTQYDLGSVVEYQGHKYKIIQPHRSQSDWTPDITPALWGRMQDGDCGDDKPSHEKQQPYETRHDAPSPAQPAPEPTPNKEEHWWESEHHKKQLEIGGGLLAGALALGAGYGAYKHHEKKKNEALQLEDWLADAKARTEAYNRGSGARIAWVLTTGHNIPPGAIEGGRDERGEVLYIARAFQGGGIHPGKASTALRKGGLIGYKLHAIEVDTYEILVGDGSAVLWVESRGLSRPGAPHPIEGGHEDTGTLLYIAQAEYSGGYHPGKAGGEFAGAFIAHGGKEVKVEKYSVLCYAQ